MCAQVVLRIAEDLPCYRCDYNLRMLSRFGRCPECGEWVSATIRHDYTRPFKFGRAAYIIAVILCYATPLLAHRLLFPGSFESELALVWWVSFFVAESLAVTGFIWSAVSLRARYSLAVFFATLVSFVYPSSLAFVTS